MNDPSWHPMKGVAADWRPDGEPTIQITPEQRQRVRVMLDRVRAELAEGRAQQAEPRPRLGRGVCSGWADEEDYGPRYED